MKLKELRKEKGMTQAQLGDATGVSKQMISGLETGTKGMGLLTLVKFADYFNCSLDYLLERSDKR